MTQFAPDNDGADEMTDDFLVDDIVSPTEVKPDPLETDYMPAARAHRLNARRRFERVAQRQALSAVLHAPPLRGESIHVVSEAKFDFWTWVPVMIDWQGATRDLYCSTWTLSRENATQMFALWDSGKIGRAHFLTGKYFKRRETAVFSYLVMGMQARNGRYRSFENHCKVLLLNNPERDIWLSVEGSANLTSNPRLEQYVLTNDRGLYEFHRGWMEECFDRYREEPR